MKDYYVYQLRLEGHLDPFYVGKGRADRAWHHMMPSNLSDDCSFKANVIKKALRNNQKVLVDMIWSDLTESESLRREVWAISLYGRRDKGEGCLTNLTDGGDGVSGLKQSDMVKAAVRKAQLGNTHRKGARHKAATIEKIKKAKTNISVETREKMSNAKKGTTVPKELAKRRMASLVGRKQEIVLCDYCGKSCSPATLSRWHNDNCKHKELL